MNDAPRVEFTLEGASADDFEALLALRLRAMRESLMQIGRFDEQVARQRLSDGFDPHATQHIVVDGARVGFLVLKRLSHALRLDHFYVDPPAQRRGIGGAVIEWVNAQADALQLPVELCALKGSAANRFYQRHGYAMVGDGPWDHDYLRVPISPGLRVVRALWRAFQARDWTAARALLHDEMQATWWTSGERFENPDVYVDVNRRYPEGWSLRLIELAHLEDGRVMSLVRVDQSPRHFYATSLFRLDDERIVGIDEYWATAEVPPAWRNAQAFPGWGRFDALADPRAREP